MQLSKLSIPLVGMHFRPPAKEVLSVLVNGTELILRPEPTNEYDMNAVMVLVDMAEFPVAKIDLLQVVIGNKWDACEICAQGLFQLGYLAASGAKTAKGGPGNGEFLLLASSIGQDNLEARLGNAPEGYPVVNIQVKE